MQQMRGFRRMKENGQYQKIAELRQEFATTPLGINRKDRLSAILFGRNHSEPDIVLRQYLIFWIGTRNLIESFLLAAGKNTSLAHPLPAQWIDIIKRKGFIVNEKRCRRLWKQQLFIMFCYAQLTIAKRVLFSLYEIYEKRYTNFGSYVYLTELSAGNLPHSETTGKSYDIFTWYLNWKGGKKHVKKYCHNVKRSPSIEYKGVEIEYLDSPVPPLNQPNLIMRFIKWGVMASLLSIKACFKGEWYGLIILKEAALAEIVRLSDKNLLPAEVLFNNSTVIYRPLWTYDAEIKGTVNSIYLYSVNSGRWKINGKLTQMPLWKPMTWSRYLLWDVYDKRFIDREAQGKYEVVIVGPIWFKSSGKSLGNIPDNSFAVFDVQPIRDILYSKIGFDFDYYIPDIANRFLLDIYEVINEHHGFMVLKRKRDWGKKVHPKYTALLDKLRSYPNFIEIDPEISAEQLIMNCKAVITMPYSSPAIIADRKNVPSIYYDPVDFIDQDDEISPHGIKRLITKEGLNSWIENTLSENV